MIASTGMYKHFALLVGTGMRKTRARTGTVTHYVVDSQVQGNGQLGKNKDTLCTHAWVTALLNKHVGEERER